MILNLRQVSDLQVGLKVLATITENKEYLKDIEIDDRELFFLSFSVAKWLVNTKDNDDLFTQQNRKLYSKYGVEELVNNKPTGQFILKSEHVDVYNNLYIELCSQLVEVEGSLIKLSSLEKLKVGGMVLTSLAPIIDIDIEELKGAK